MCVCVYLCLTCCIITFIHVAMTWHLALAKKITKELIIIIETKSGGKLVFTERSKYQILGNIPCLGVE